MARYGPRPEGRRDSQRRLLYTAASLHLKLRRQESVCTRCGHDALMTGKMIYVMFGIESRASMYISIGLASRRASGNAGDGVKYATRKHIIIV